MWSTLNLFDYFVIALFGIIAIFSFFYKKVENSLETSVCDRIQNGRENTDKSDSLDIVEITNKWQCREACSRLMNHCRDLTALGFDCEWVSQNGVQRPVALLQLATVHGLCCLFRLNILGGIPLELRDILCNSQILKLGISPLNDSKLLKRDYNVQVCSTLDLRYLYPGGRSLASLAYSVLGISLNKSWWLQCSDWESPELTELQKDYAAKDALVAIEMFKKWLLSKKNFSNSNNDFKFRYRLDEDLRRELFWCLDVNFKPNNAFLTPTKNTGLAFESYNNQDKKKIRSGYVTRKAPLYHNCFMHAPDGELLCSCDRRKAQWYLDRGLAEVLQQDPYSIRLLFKPAARPGTTNGGRFYQQLKQNQCVVCGAHQSYLKHNVVPKEYRKHFPKIMKDHQSHDIVLMCLRCHHVATQHNELLRQQLALVCNAPINNSKVTQNRSLQTVKNSAKALLVSGDVIPKERKIFLENKVKAYFNVNTLTISLLKIAENLDSKVIGENSDCHGIRVVNYFIKNHGGLTKLELLWRKHFLATMEPQHLPALWSITHNHSRLAINQN